MKLYLRFFDNETLISTMEEAVAFLESLPDLNPTETMITELDAYFNSKKSYSKRFKVGPHSYFIAIKSNVETMEEFKAHGAGEITVPSPAADAKEAVHRTLQEEKPGWYEAEITFKRVMLDENGKCQYVDTDFGAKLKADSIQDCYNRVLDYLRNRDDVDSRSQYPSVKGRNFKAVFLGEEA